MTKSPRRYQAASAIAIVLAAYAAVFARQTHNHVDLPIFIDPLEWVTSLTSVAAAWAAWNKLEQRAAIFIVVALFLFFGVQVDWLFRVPLGFGFVTVASLAFLLTLPVTWKPK